MSHHVSSRRNRYVVRYGAVRAVRCQPVVVYKSAVLALALVRVDVWTCRRVDVCTTNDHTGSARYYSYNRVRTSIN